MMNDYKGELTEFALVVPVPVVLQKSQIHVGEPKIFDRIDAYSAPVGPVGSASRRAP